MIFFLHYAPSQQVKLVVWCLFLDSRPFSQLLFTTIAYWLIVYTKAVFSWEIMQLLFSSFGGWFYFPGMLFLFFSLFSTQFSESAPDIFHDIFPNTPSHLSPHACLAQSSNAENSIWSVMFVFLLKTAEKRKRKIFTI